MSRWPHADDLRRPGGSPTSASIHAELLNLNCNRNLSLFFSIPASLCKTLAGKASQYKFIVSISLLRKSKSPSISTLDTQNNFAIQMQIFVLLPKTNQMMGCCFRPASQSNPQNRDISPALLYYPLCHFQRWIRRADTRKQDKVGLNQKVWILCKP